MTENLEIVKTELTEKEQKIDRRKTMPHLFKKGQSGNLKGRTKGAFSIKDTVRSYLQTHPKDFEDFVEHFIKKNRELAWRMLEGNPPTDLNLGNADNLPFQIEISVKKDENKG